MAENVDARNLVAPVAAAAEAAAPTTFSDLPDDLKVSIFEARMQEDPTWVRETFPLINRACSVIFRTRQASSLHATVHVDFAPRGGGHLHVRERRRLVAPRAGAVRKLVIDIGRDSGSPMTARATRGGRLGDPARRGAALDRALCQRAARVDAAVSLGRPLWRSLSAVVAPAANLRSLHIETYDS